MVELDPQGEPDLSPPVAPDEGYWEALIQQGEFANRQSDSDYNGNGYHSLSNELSVEEFNLRASYTNQDDWKLAQETYDNDGSIDLNVTGYNRGGLLVSWKSLRGFVPASQLVDFPVDIDEQRRRGLLSRYVGNQLRLRIIELEIDKNRLILSERAAQVEAGQRADILDTLKSGVTLKGVVTNLCDFGAFVDLGGVEGLIHISELSWGRVNHPRDVLRSGQEVEIYIMTVDSDDERIALSLKRLQPDPWATVEARYKVGQEIEGTITNVVDFGAFACIEEGLEGLIHISELAEGQFLHPRNVVNEGDNIVARILNIDGSNRRLGLSLRFTSNHSTGSNDSNDNTIFNKGTV